MVDKITEDLAIDREAKMAHIAGELIFQTLRDLTASVDKRMLGKINCGEKMSQEDSWVAWGEKNAYARLEKRLRQKIQLGSGARERLEPHMNVGAEE